MAEHLALAEQLPVLAELLCSPFFLCAKTAQSGLSELLQDFQRLDGVSSLPNLLRYLQGALERNVSNVMNQPSALPLCLAATLSTVAKAGTQNEKEGVEWV